MNKPVRLLALLLTLLIGGLLPAEAQLRPPGVPLSEPEPDSPPPLPTVSEREWPAPVPPWGEQGLPELETFPPRPTLSQYFQNSLGMEFVLIPAGSFVMGSPASEKERENDETPHRVTLTRAYYLQATEVTQGQWRAVMGTTVRQQADKENPQYKLAGEGSNYPIYFVSWEEVQEFIRRLNQRGEGQYRLPTEAEWEYAARAGSQSAYHFGDTVSQLPRYGNFADRRVIGQWNDQVDGWADRNADDGHATAAPVGSYRPNAWGLYDMHGNVWEWVQDWYGDYPSGAVSDPQGPSSGVVRVARGGGWCSLARGARSANRHFDSPDYRFFILGFRLLRGL